VSVLYIISKYEMTQVTQLYEEEKFIFRINF